MKSFRVQLADHACVNRCIDEKQPSNGLPCRHVLKVLIQDYEQRPNLFDPLKGFFSGFLPGDLEAEVAKRHGEIGQTMVIG